MIDSRTDRHRLQRRASLSLALTALAHLPPLFVVQRLDTGILRLLTRLWPARDADSFAAAPFPRDTMANVPSTLGIGPSDPAPDLLREWSGAAWTQGPAWLLAIVVIVMLLTTESRPRTMAFAVASPFLLAGTSVLAFVLVDVWVPIAGPGLLLLFFVCSSLIEPNRRSLPALAGLAAAPGSDASLLPTGVAAGWQPQRALHHTREQLPELYAIGTSLARDGHRELAATAFLRVLRLDPDYEDAAQQLVQIANPQAIADEATRVRLRDEMPECLGRYRLLEPIGQGATGRVYLAFDPVINRLVAVKLIDLSLERDDREIADAEERFLREAETAGRLNHPNIITIHDMGETRGCAYIAMEYVKGVMLSQHTATGRLLPPNLVLELMALAADGLDYAHSQNVIHRDIKPGNIMYDSISGDLKITDFGIARLVDVQRTRTGVVLGTPSFMSPEQIEGGNVKGNTDLFALGVSLYELLTGQLPFHGTSMTKLMFVIANEPHTPLTAVRPDLPGAIDPVIDTALSKNPATRYQRGAEMAAELRAIARNMS